MRVSQVYTAAPSEERCAVEMETFALLDRLGIPYTWVAHDMANTIEDCAAVDAALGISICKNLFLCNRQKTEFYLLAMPGDKLFQTKELSRREWRSCWAAPLVLPVCWEWPTTRAIRFIC